jgi:hypothetical protein
MNIDSIAYEHSIAYYSSDWCYYNKELSAIEHGAILAGAKLREKDREKRKNRIKRKQKAK